MWSKFSEKIKNVKLKQMAYPVILGVFILITVFLFVSVAKFLSRNINKSFVTETEIQSELTKLDVPAFYRVAKKLGINPETISSETPPAAPTVETTIETTAEESTTTESKIIQKDKKSLRIAVFNSTNKIGLAAELKTNLTDVGFIVEKTSNQSPTEELTLLKVKENEQNSPAIGEIFKIVSQKYADVTIQKLEETETYDAIIVIGNR